MNNNIKSERVKKGMTTSDLAEVMGVTPSCISFWESGRSEPKFDDLRKMREIFGCTLDYLLGVTEERL